LHLPNEALLKVTGVPSLLQIAGHHVFNTVTVIRDRFTHSPSSLNDLATSLSQAAEGYKTLNSPEPLRVITGNSFVLDLLGLGKGFERDLLGLATGVFLTLRCTLATEGVVGSIRRCTACGRSATQAHFLNECPANEEARKFLRCSIPQGITVPVLSGGDFTAFFIQIRCLTVTATKREVAEEGSKQLTDSAVTAASMFVTKSLQANASKP
jgi:hypothetical protein